MIDLTDPYMLLAWLVAQAAEKMDEEEAG